MQCNVEYFTRKLGVRENTQKIRQLNSRPELNLTKLKQVETLIEVKTGYQITELQRTLLSNSLFEPDKTYENIAQETNYSLSYIKRFAAPKLWKLLSESCAQKVNKVNCRHLVEKILINSATSPNLPESPWGSVPLFSFYYITRSPIDPDGYEEILKRDTVIRIEAAQKTGKTSLITRMLEAGKQQNNHRVYLTLKLAECEALNSTEQFLKWFCVNIAQQLAIPSKLDDYWEEQLGYLINCTQYFQSYLLPRLQHPLVLAIDDIDQVLSIPALRRDFLRLLRYWYEEFQCKAVEPWGKLRLILSFSTEIYTTLGMNRSPLNFGRLVELTPLSFLQVVELIQLHGLNLSEQKLTQIIELCGGFPYLVRRLLYEKISSEVTWEELIETAATDWGIFSNHLQEKLEWLETNENLVETYKDVLNAQLPLQLNWKQAFQLKSLGLVHSETGTVRVSCGLYRQYFQEHLE